MGMGSRHITYQVSLAVLVLDDFTDQVLKGASVQIKASGLPGRPIRKGDGYFVFTSDQGEIRQIEVESPFYQKAVVKIEPEQLHLRRPVIKIRLQPNKRYAAPKALTYLEGQAQPGSEIQVIPQEPLHVLKLLYDYENEGPEGTREIHLFQGEKKDLAGKTFGIRGKGQEEAELFRIWEMTDQEQGSCVLEKPLGRTYKKAGTTVFPVYVAKAEESGAYFLWLQGLEGKAPCPCRILNDGEKGLSSWDMDLKPGQGNRLDLTAAEGQKGAG